MRLYEIFYQYLRDSLCTHSFINARAIVLPIIQDLLNEIQARKSSAFQLISPSRQTLDETI